MLRLTPWRIVLANTAIRKLWPLPSVTTHWRIRGQWYRFRDATRSITLKLVYEETCKGFYAPQVALRPGDVVVDVGAHVGAFTIPLAREHPGTRFLCFEPNPDNYENLLHNIRVNGVQNVEAVNAGVWDGAGYLVNQPDPQNTGGNRVRAAGFEDDPDCLAYSFPEIRRKWGLARIRLLKMDCEGAEYHALRTASDVAGVDDLLLEVHGGEYANLVKLARTVPLHRIQILQDSHVVLDSAGAWKPTSLGVPA